MPRLKVIHKPAGYEAWKDEKVIASPNYQAIAIILGSVFGAGGLCVAVLFLAFLPPSEETPLPTRVVIEIPTQTPVMNVLVVNQINATSTATPTETLPSTATPEATPEATPDYQATVDALLQASPPTQQVKSVTSRLPIAFCGDAPFSLYGVGTVAVVRFENKSALRLLDQPRQPDQRQPNVLKQLYDGDLVEITGEPVCGAWLGASVVYYPVYVERWQRDGWVGFGMNGDTWLEAAG